MTVEASAPADAIPVLRRAGGEDAAPIADLFWRVRQQCAPAIPPIAYPRDTVEPYVRDTMLTSGEVWVAEDPAGGLVGFLALSEPDHLDHLYLDAPATGAGLGARFVALARERLPRGLQLWAFQSNVDAIRFYEREGFRQVQWTEGDNAEGAPDVRMVWTP